LQHLKPFLTRLLFSITALFFALAIIHYNNIDIRFQSLFFDFDSNSWLISRDNQILKFIFYRMPKYLIITYGLSLIIYLICNKNADLILKKKITFLIFALIITPVVVAIIKHYSPIYCPYNIKEFYGCCIYISPLDVFKHEFFTPNIGKCFPAGHASGGFALMSLYFVISKTELRKSSLILSLALGWIMGFYQIAKGAHYLSDTLFTMTVAYIVSISLLRLLKLD
jgi:membrane-associated PAP2 superfamily phosphatase